MDKVKHQYLAGYFWGDEKNKQTFMLLDIAENKISMDKELIDRLYKPGLKDRDTLMLDFGKGLFGIEYLKKEKIKNEQ